MLKVCEKYQMMDEGAVMFSERVRRYFTVEGYLTWLLKIKVTA
jgi:hypothetical protein